MSQISNRDKYFSYKSIRVILNNNQILNYNINKSEYISQLKITDDMPRLILYRKTFMKVMTNIEELSRVFFAGKGERCDGNEKK